MQTETVKIKFDRWNLNQSLFPKDAKLLPNPNGTAMGAYLAFKQRQYILLPGPPRECIPMFHNYVLPLLKENTRLITSY